jgi:hypothetical protein
MRRILLASAAIFGASGGLATAQTLPNQMQGQYIAPLLGGPGANNNLNTFGTAAPGAAVRPTPGSVVIRLNGKVYTEFDYSSGTSMSNAAHTINAGNTVGGVLQTNPTGYKLNPVGVGAYFRLFPGIDAMATNGLRYGAGVEIRQNFEGGNSFQVSSAINTNAAGATTGIATTLPSGTAISGTAAGASGNSSSETLFVRRAFVYFGSDQTGIIRMGMADGLPGIYDATGVFTVGAWDGGIGNLLNSGVQAVTPNENLIAWPFQSGNGQEYDANRVVYLSPSFYGVDFGIEFAPSQGNVFSNGATSDPYAVGPCATASANCIGVTSGSDSSRWINRWAGGARFIENVGGAIVQGFGEWTTSGTSKNPLAKPAGPNTAIGQAGLAGATGALRYDNQNFFVAGLAVTYMGVTLNADVSHGRENGTNGTVTTGGAPETGVIGGASYAIGPIAFGADAAVVDSQGSVQLTHVSQRHQFGFAVGGVYKIAPGLNLCAEYQYLQYHQGGYNWASGAVGTPIGNDTHTQGMTLAAIMNW